MPHRQADIRIAPIDHRGTKPSSDSTLSKGRRVVNDCGVAHGVRHWSQNQGINADDQIIEVGQEAKLEPEALQHPLLQLAGVADARYIQELPRHSSIKTMMVYTHITPKATLKIVRTLDQLVNLQNNNSNHHQK